MKYLVMIQGGLGPDVWDKEVEIDAADFMDAARQAQGKAEYYGGHVAQLEMGIPPDDAERRGNDPRCTHGTLVDHCPDCAPDRSCIFDKEKSTHEWYLQNDGSHMCRRCGARGIAMVSGGGK